MAYHADLMYPTVPVVLSRGTGDCAVVALAQCLDRSYEDVLAAAARIADISEPHNRGLTVAQIKRTAKAFGATLVLRRAFDLDIAEGIVGFSTPQGYGHVSFIKRGLVWAVDGVVWEHEYYCRKHRYVPVSFLERTA